MIIHETFTLIRRGAVETVTNWWATGYLEASSYYYKGENLPKAGLRERAVKLNSIG